MNVKWPDLISVLAVVIALMSWLPGSARAQYAVDKPLDSLRAPFSGSAVYSASIQFEAVSATTGNPVLVGTATKVPSMNLVLDSKILADIAGNKTNTLTVTGLRATFTATGGTGWKLRGPVPVAVEFDAPFAIAPGQKVGCRYDMPAQTFSPSTLSWGPAGGGRLRCQPGMLASAIPDLAAPAPTPTQAPTPTPPPPVGQSPTGATCPTVCPLIDKNGVAWKVVGNSVTANGVLIPLPGGYSDSNSLAMQSNGLVRIISPSRGYFCTTPAGVVIDC